MSTIIYLLHFDRRVSHCLHYIGSTLAQNFNRRMREHCRGHGANLTAEAFEQSVPFIIARLWHEEDRKLELRLKRNSHFEKLCPICNTNLKLQLPERPASATLTGLSKSRFRSIGF